MWPNSWRANRHGDIDPLLRDIDGLLPHRRIRIVKALAHVRRNIHDAHLSLLDRPAEFLEVRRLRALKMLRQRLDPMYAKFFNHFSRELRERKTFLLGVAATISRRVDQHAERIRSNRDACARFRREVDVRLSLRRGAKNRSR